MDKPIVKYKLGKSHKTPEEYKIVSNGISAWIVKEDYSKYCIHACPEYELLKWLSEERDPEKDDVCVQCNSNKKKI